MTVILWLWPSMFKRQQAYVDPLNEECIALKYVFKRHCGIVHRPLYARRYADVVLVASSRVKVEADSAIRDDVNLEGWVGTGWKRDLETLGLRKRFRCCA